MSKKQEKIQRVRNSAQFRSLQLDPSRAVEILFALLVSFDGRLDGLNAARILSGGSEKRLEELIKNGTVREYKKKVRARNSKRQISLSDCIMNASVV